MSERKKILLSSSLFLSLFLTLAFILSYYKVQVFQGDRVEAANLLGNIIQCLAAITAIVFTVILFLGQFSLGKYVTRTIDYVLLDWRNFATLSLFTAVLLLNIVTLWNLSMEYWRLYVDVSVLLSVFCLTWLFPYFWSIPRCLQPRKIFETIQKEVNSKKQKNIQFVRDKIELLFSIVSKLRDNGESSDALYGLELIGKISRSIDLKEDQYLFRSLITSKLEDIGVESLEVQPGLALRCIDELRNLLTLAKPKGFSFDINLGNQIVSSSLTICKNSLPKAHAKNFVLKTYSLILYFYQLSALDDGIAMLIGSQALEKILSYSSQVEIPNYHWLSFEPQWVISNLLKNKKEKEAFFLFSMLYNYFPKDQECLLFSLGVLLTAKDRKEFSVNVVEKIRNSFGPLNVNIKTIQDRSGYHLTVSSEHEIEIEISNEDREHALWIRDSLGCRGHSL